METAGCLRLFGAGMLVAVAIIGILAALT